MNEDGPEWAAAERHAFNLRAALGMTAATLVAMVALFVVPWLEGWALDLWPAFALLCVVEGGAALVVVFFLRRLHGERSYE